MFVQKLASSRTFCHYVTIERKYTFKQKLLNHDSLRSSSTEKINTLQVSNDDHIEYSIPPSSERKKSRIRDAITAKENFVNKTPREKNDALYTKHLAKERTRI